MKSAFDKIAAGIEDAIAFTNGDATRARKANVDVKAIRAATGSTQAGFAKRYCFPVATIRDWEQGRRQPDSGSTMLLKMIAADPDGVRHIIARIER